MALLMLGTLAGFVQGATMASFTDTAASSSNTFSTGTVDISTSPETTITTLTFANMIPGDKVTAPLTVTNCALPCTAGLTLSYSISSLATNSGPGGLGSELTLRIRNNSSSTCNNTQFNNGGTTDYYGSAISPSALTGSLVTRPSISSGSSDSLCFQIALPSAAGIAYQGATTTVTFTFTATAS